MTKSLKKIEAGEELNTMQDIEKAQALALEASKDAVGSFKDATNKKDNAQGLMAGAIFSLFKQSNHLHEISASLLNAQLAGNKGDASKGLQNLYEKLGLIESDKPNQSLDDQYKEFNKTNKGFQTIVSDGNKLALAAWQHDSNTITINKLGNNQLVVKVRQDFYTEDKIAAADNVVAIGRRTGYKPFSELLSESKKKLGIVAEKNPKSAGGTEAAVKPQSLRDLITSLRATLKSVEGLEQSELEALENLDRDITQVLVDNTPAITGKVRKAA